MNNLELITKLAHMDLQAKIVICVNEVSYDIFSFIGRDDRIEIELSTSEDELPYSYFKHATRSQLVDFCTSHNLHFKYTENHYTMCARLMYAIRDAGMVSTFVKEMIQDDNS